MTSDSSYYTEPAPDEEGTVPWWDDPGDLPPCPDCRGRCYEDDFDEVPCPRCHGEGVLDVGYML